MNARVMPSWAAGASLQRDEFPFSDEEFERVRLLIHQHAGIVLTPSKRDMAYGRLVRRLRACGALSFGDYLGRVGRDGAERERFINALTTNLTSFFREGHHFDALGAHMKALAQASPRRLRIWCAAASTGEEPYSLAITACEAFARLDPPVEIIASDIDTDALAQCVRGQYPAEKTEGLANGRLQRHFVRREPGGEVQYEVRPELRRLVSFRRINLLDRSWPLSGAFDAIFCRNVMIYFDKPARQLIARRFAPLLLPQGRLYIGHSESLADLADLYRPLGRTVYEPVGACRA